MPAPVITGSEGAIQFDFGPGLRYTANVFSWRVSLGRETLDTTKQGDEAKTRTGGLADHIGSLSIRIQLSDDNSEANSAWQVLSYAIDGSDDQLKAQVRLIVQSSGAAWTCDNSAFDSYISESVYLDGTVVIAGVSIDCTEPSEPLVAEINWEADGKLLLTRS